VKTEKEFVSDDILLWTCDWCRLNRRFDVRFCSSDVIFGAWRPYKKHQPTFKWYFDLLRNCGLFLWFYNASTCCWHAKTCTCKIICYHNLHFITRHLLAVEYNVYCSISVRYKLTVFGESKYAFFSNIIHCMYFISQLFSELLVGRKHIF